MRYRREEKNCSADAVILVFCEVKRPSICPRESPVKKTFKISDFRKRNKKASGILSGSHGLSLAGPRLEWRWWINKHKWVLLKKQLTWTSHRRLWKRIWSPPNLRHSGPRGRSILDCPVSNETGTTALWALTAQRCLSKARQSRNLCQSLAKCRKSVS